MTEKRFKCIDLIILDGFIRDNVENENIDDEKEIVELLNELHDKLDRFEFILQEAIRTERTDMGKNVLIQLADSLGVKYE